MGAKRHGHPYVAERRRRTPQDDYDDDYYSPPNDGRHHRGPNPRHAPPPPHPHHKGSSTGRLYDRRRRHRARSRSCSDRELSLTPSYSSRSSDTNNNTNGNSGRHHHRRPDSRHHPQRVRRRYEEPHRMSRDPRSAAPTRGRDSRRHHEREKGREKEGTEEYERPPRKANAIVAVMREEMCNEEYTQYERDKRLGQSESTARDAASLVAEQQQQLLSALDRELEAHRGRCGRHAAPATIGTMVNKADTVQGQKQPQEGEATEEMSVKPSLSSSLIGVDSSTPTVPSCRIVLYGVDLCVQPCHLNSMLEQVVGRRPLSVLRPAAELWQSRRDTARANARESSSTDTATTDTTDFVRSRAVDSSLHLGLYDVHGAGGVVVLELPRDGGVVAAAIAALNGACVNGRLITATVAAR